MTTENDNTKETQLAKRREYVPTAPVGSTGGLKSLMEMAKDSIAQALPRHVTPERLIKTMLVAANRNPMILQCTQASVFETISRAAELGLDLSGTLGEAYPVPFKNSVKDANGNWQKLMQLTLIIGYRGLEKLCWQSGEVTMIDAEVVYENDKFVFRKGFEPVLDFEPSLSGDRGDPIGAYALIITKNGGRMARFMPTSDIEKVRQAAISKDSPAWKNHWDEMARKTALRRVLKDAPLSTEKLVKAMEVDDANYDFARAAMESEQTPGTAGLTARLTGADRKEPTGDDDYTNGDVPHDDPADDDQAADAPTGDEPQDADAGAIHANLLTVDKDDRYDALVDTLGTLRQLDTMEDAAAAADELLAGIKCDRRSCRIDAKWKKIVAAAAKE
jgi:recombination protein RecT